MDLRDIFDKLGLTGGKWQWRALRIERAWAAFVATMRGKRQQVTYRHKFCTNCGALMDAADTECSRCGEKGERWETQVADRFFSRLIPGGRPVTGGLFIVNAMMFAVMIGIYGAGNLMHPSGEALTKMGMLFPRELLWGEYWRYVTYGYLHIGIIHFLFNMFVLTRVGPMMEDEIGSPRFFVIYCVSLLGGGWLIALGDHPAAGASGALFGCIGFGAAYGHFHGGATGQRMRNYFVSWILYAYVFGFIVGNVSHAAHTGGLIAGAVAGYVVQRERPYRDRLNRHWLMASRLCVAMTIAAFVWMIMARGGAMR